MHEAPRLVLNLLEQIKAEDAAAKAGAQAVREAKQALQEAEEAALATEDARAKLEEELAVARQDARPDAERIMERLRKELAVSIGSHGQAALVQAAFGDLLALRHEEPQLLRTAAAATAASKKRDFLTAALAALLRAPAEQPAPRDVLQALLVPLLELAMGGGRSGAPWVTMCKAAAAVDDAALTSKVVDGALARAAEMAPACSAASAALMPPSSGYSATLSALAALAGNGAGTRRNCPLLDLLRPCAEELRARAVAGSASSGAGVLRLERALRQKLRAELSACSGAQVGLDGVVPPNYAMPAEAALIGGSDARLCDFLLSATQREVSIAAGKAGRMALHRLIDGRLPYGVLSHESHGLGADRALLVRKIGVRGAEHIEQQRQLQAEHRKLLDALEAT